MALRFPIDPPDIPTEPTEAVQANILEMIAYIDFGLRQDLGDGDLRSFAVEALKYARGQLVRLHDSLDEDVDLLAWIGRCLFELLLLSRYALQSQENLRDVMVRQIGEMVELDRAWFDGDPGDRNDPDVADFKGSVAAMEAFAQDWELKVPGRFNQRDLAKQTDSLREFYVIYKTLSKYAHPTPYFLFGKDSFVRGKNARKVILVAAQVSAAWFLDEFPGLVEQLRVKRSEEEKGTAG